VDGLMAFCHDARKSRYIGSHWPNHVRASALLDHFQREPKPQKQADLIWRASKSPLLAQRQHLLGLRMRICSEASSSQ